MMFAVIAKELPEKPGEQQVRETLCLTAIRSPELERPGFRIRSHGRSKDHTRKFFIQRGAMFV